MTIKEQKLALYKKYLEKSDKSFLIIRGLTSEQISVELARMRAEYYDKLTEVPKEYTLAKLKVLVE